MGEQQVLVELEQRPRQAVPVDQLQLRQPNRDQFTYAAIDVERLVPADHLVRAIWELSGMLDLSGFAAHLETRKESAGRPAWDPRLLVAIWIWAYSERMSSAREIARQSRYRPELEWLCGMAVVNHHTLSDFRVFHSKALENLLTQVLALLSQEGLVDLEQVAVDGTRIRAQASGGSQRRRPTLERHLEQAREAVRQLSEEADDEGSNRRRQAARKRTLRERVERMEQALEELPKVEAGKRDEEQRRQARVSESEPEARPQHEIQRRLGTRLQRAAGDRRQREDRGRRGVDQQRLRCGPADPDAGRCGRALRANPEASVSGRGLRQPGQHRGAGSR